MILRRNARGILFRELAGDQYYLKSIPQNSVKYMLDIGANVGIISIFARLLHPDMKILAVEPHPLVYSNLVSNVENMKIGCLNIAMGNGNPFYLVKDRKTNLCNSFAVEKTENYEIKSMTLYDIIIQSRFDPKDLFIKIDCEGAEKYLLKDSKSIEIMKQAKYIAIEVHDKLGIVIKDFNEEIIALLSDSCDLIKINRTVLVFKGKI